MCSWTGCRRVKIGYFVLQQSTDYGLGVRWHPYCPKHGVKFKETPAYKNSALEVLHYREWEWKKLLEE